MLTFFEALIIGHLIGDYVLQNNWMAQRKRAHLFPCIVHCVLYTLCVCMLTSWSPWWALVVFASHFPIDKWGLANNWLKAFGGRTIDEFLDNGHNDVYVTTKPTFVGNYTRSPQELIDQVAVELKRKSENYIILRGGFTTFVYIVVDNTMHLILMLLGAYYLKKYGLM